MKNHFLWCSIQNLLSINLTCQKTNNIRVLSRCGCGITPAGTQTCKHGNRNRKLAYIIPIKLCIILTRFVSLLYASLSKKSYYASSSLDFYHLFYSIIYNWFDHLFFKYRASLQNPIFHADAPAQRSSYILVKSRESIYEYIYHTDHSCMHTHMHTRACCM